MSKVELTTEMIDHIKRKTATYGKAKLVLRNGKYRISLILWMKSLNKQVEANNVSIRQKLLQIKDVDDCRLSDDVSEMSRMKYRNGMKRWLKKNDM